jgi:hypothetical protein
MRRREFITLLGGGNRGVAYVVDAPGRDEAGQPVERLNLILFDFLDCHGLAWT